MPSTKNPVIVVNAGPGKIPAGTVTASSLMFPPGGGSGAALEAHITDPTDAHMSNAIGMEATHPRTGQSIRWDVGGPVDGESVLDFIVAAMDAFPIRPDTLGTNSTFVANSGIPSWDALDPVGVGFTGSAVVGAFTRGTNVIHTNNLIPSVWGVSPYGMLYPADRGVIALYHSAAGDPISAGTLLGALWLGDNYTTVPAGMPPNPWPPIFWEGNRVFGHGDYSPSGLGLDQFGLTNRLPYLRDYSPYITGYSNFATNFYRYQIALLFTNITFPVARELGSWMLIHWKETYATTLAAIQPALIPANLNSTNAYSVSSGPDIDNIQRLEVYMDPGTDPAPDTNTTTSTANLTLPGPFFVMLSGVGFCNGLNLRFDLTLTISDLFTGAYYTGEYPEVIDPLVFDYADFGYGTISYNLTQIKNDVSGSYFSDVNAPPMGINSREELVN